MTDEAVGADDGEGNGTAPYLAVIYFHGMGSQRRYEETSRLIDRLDTFLNRRSRQGTPGILANIKPRVEPDRCRPNSEEIVGYIRTVHADSTKMENPFVVRFYETYWAPIMAEQKSPWEILQWMFSNPAGRGILSARPGANGSGCGEQPLARILEPKLIANPQGQDAKDYKQLVSLYTDFEGLEAQRSYVEGTFAEFEQFIAAKVTQPQDAQRLTAQARIWQSEYFKEEARNAFVLFSLAILVVLIAVGALAVVLAVLQFLLGIPTLVTFLGRANLEIKADWPTVSGIAAFVLIGFFGLGKFLTEYLGDVQVWATYEETDAKFEARNKVLARSIDLFSHVLSDPACERVVVVAHSLGTSVAHDALLALTRRNRARNAQDPIAGPLPLTKIEHFVTMGSPIDKIEYLFESYSSQSHRYKRVVEAFRGDIGTPPFSRNRKPFIHWINFWDRGDIISGPLTSPSSSTASAQSVDNVHVANYDFPDPSASHGGYFDNKTVIQTLYEVIYRRGLSFRALTSVPGQGPDYSSVFMHPGEPEIGRPIILATALIVPWIMLAAAIAWLFNATSFAAFAALLGGGIAVVLFLSRWASKLKGQRTPL